MKSIYIEKDNIHFTNKIKDDKIILSTENSTEDSECSKFWIEKGSMHLEFTDSYQTIYYKNRK